MPGSVRDVDASPHRFDPEDETPSPAQPRVDKRKSRSLKSRFSLVQLPPSPADSDGAMRQGSPRGTSPSATTKEERRILRPIDRGSPGDGAIFSDSKTPEQKVLAKKKSQYYNDVFSTREPNTSARERISKESPILADVRTNVIIGDEYTFITDLSYNLSTRYQRPESSIVVTVAHSCCMLFGGNFDPAYSLTISALGSQLKPITNKRNASLIAKVMEEGLGVAPNRGVIRFIPIPEDNLATNGKTITGEIEELEKETTEINANLQRSLSRSTEATKSTKTTPLKTKRRQSLRSLKNLLPTHNEDGSQTPPFSEHETPPLPAMPSQKSPTDRRAEKVQKMGRRKSFVAAIFGK